MKVPENNRITNGFCYIFKYHIVPASLTNPQAWKFIETKLDSLVKKFRSEE